MPLHHPDRSGKKGVSFAMSTERAPQEPTRGMPPSMRPRFSLVVPIFNEEEVLPTTYARVKRVMENTGERFEVIFVDDGSRDGSRQLLDELSHNDRQVRALHFSRNFGHQTAITAGLDYARGEAIIVLDGDLQDPPELIPDMIERWREGFDVVYAKRTARQGESLFKRWSAALFYRLLRFLTDVDIPMDTGDFRLIDRKVSDTLKTLTERSRFIRGLVAWTGFRQTAVEYVREPRLMGQPKYSLGKMLRLGVDAITAFSDKPLRLALYVGSGLALISLLGLVVLLVVAATTASTASPAWILSLALAFINSVALLTLGILGQYVARIHDEVRHRPLYILDPSPTDGDDDHA